MPVRKYFQINTINLTLHETFCLSKCATNILFTNMLKIQYYSNIIAVISHTRINLKGTANV